MGTCSLFYWAGLLVAAIGLAMILLANWLMWKARQILKRATEISLEAERTARRSAKLWADTH